MRTDNNEHKALFTIPTAAYSSALANIKPLPEQRRITGHKQTDAYLWVLEVIRLNEPAHLDAAEAALVKIKISPKEAQERYSRYLLANGYEPFQVAFGIIGMDNPAQVIRNARENIKKAASVRLRLVAMKQRSKMWKQSGSSGLPRNLSTIISGAGLRQRKKPEALAAAA